MVEVPADLEVVGHEADRAHEDVGHAPRAELLEVVEDVRGQPRLTRLRLALELEGPLGETGPPRDEVSGLQQLISVRIA